MSQTDYLGDINMYDNIVYLIRISDKNIISIFLEKKWISAYHKIATQVQGVMVYHYYEIHSHNDMAIHDAMKDYPGVFDLFKCEDIFNNNKINELV